MSISKKNARRIRKGVRAATDTITANKAGMPLLPSPVAMDELAQRAYLRTLRAELTRIARRALRAATMLKGGE